jgi:hypothetical protein
MGLIQCATARSAAHSNLCQRSKGRIAADPSGVKASDEKDGFGAAKNSIDMSRDSVSICV